MDELKGESNLTASPGLVVNLSFKHIMAAASFSRRVGEIEFEHKGQPYGDYWDEIFSLSTGCVLTATASLEAYANELFFDRNKAFSEYAPELLHDLWEMYEQKSSLQKFEFALLLRRCPKFDRGVPVYQNVDALIQLRNALVHFQPEVDNEAVGHKKLSETLKQRFDISRFFEDALIFPRRWATHGCTEWAVQTAVRFANEFASRAGFAPKFVQENIDRELRP